MAEKCRECGAKMVGFASTDGSVYSDCEATSGSGSHEFVIGDLRTQVTSLGAIIRQNEVEHCRKNAHIDAKDAALREAKDYIEGMAEAAGAAAAARFIDDALSDTGEGWQEGRRLILEAFDSLPGWPDDWYGDVGLCLMCSQSPHGDDCWVGKCERGLAALAALEGK